jgi:ABC-type Na+ efflux pump permease subunit
LACLSPVSGDKWTSFLPYAVTMVVVYPIGIPVGVLSMLIYNRNRLGKLGEDIVRIHRTRSDADSRFCYR